MTLLHLGHLAAHLRAHPPAALPWPQQARFGNCWLLTALVGLGVNALLHRVALQPEFAQVSLAHCSVRVDYWLPPGLVALRTPEDLYCALVCKAVCAVLHKDGEDLFLACHGGYVSTALALLGGSEPLTFCETRRGNCWHSLLLLERRGDALLCYDPNCAGAVEVPQASCTIVSYESKMRWRMCFCFERDKSPPLFRYKELRRTSRDSEIFDARGRPLNG